MTVFFAMLLRPFLYFFVLACICLPARFAVKRFMPECRLKEILLFDFKEERKKVKARLDAQFTDNRQN